MVGAGRSNSSWLYWETHLSCTYFSLSCTRRRGKVSTSVMQARGITSADGLQHEGYWEGRRMVWSRKELLWCIGGAGEAAVPVPTG